MALIINNMKIGNTYCYVNRVDNKVTWLSKPIPTSSSSTSTNPVNFFRGSAIKGITISSSNNLTYNSSFMTQGSTMTQISTLPDYINEFNDLSGYGKMSYELNFCNCGYLSNLTRFFDFLGTSYSGYDVGFGFGDTTTGFEVQLQLLNNWWFTNLPGCQLQTRFNTSKKKCCIINN